MSEAPNTSPDDHMCPHGYDRRMVHCVLCEDPAALTAAARPDMSRVFTGTISPRSLAEETNPLGRQRPSKSHDAGSNPAGEAVTSNLVTQLRAAIAKIPTREERLGGQTFKYVKLSEVLDLLDTSPHETSVPPRVFDLTAELRRYFDSSMLNKTSDLYLLLCEIEAMRSPVKATAELPRNCVHGQPIGNHCWYVGPPEKASAPVVAGQDFDKDLAHLDGIRKTMADMKRYGSLQGIPMNEADFLLTFIDNLWREYTRAVNGSVKP